MRLCKILVFLFAVVTVGFQVGSAAPQGTTNFNMTNFSKAWDEYTTNPTKEMALQLYELLPPGKMTPGGLQPDIKDKILSKLNVIESQIYSGERNALKVAFRLFNIADNEIQTALVKIIGYLLRFDTKLFLEELMLHEALVPDLGQLVCSFQQTSPDDKAQQELERNIRLKSLGYIEDKELKDIKKKCLKILKDLKIQ
ncbi:MAG: hypothetical protein QG657_3201 [Acidobacteriota bacterium]|nr:hypothetical protein [Acidobacteriota bacterium]